MTTDDNDLFYRTLSLYEEGRFLEALQLVLGDPNDREEARTSHIPEFHYLMNYLDASVFGGEMEASLTRHVFLTEIEKNSYLKIILNEGIEQLEIEHLLSNACAHDLLAIEIKKVPARYQKFVEQKQNRLKRVRELCQRKKGLEKLLLDPEIVKKIPWHSFGYSSPLIPYIEEKETIPLVILEPYSTINYSAVLAPYFNKEVIYVCLTYSDFFHLLEHNALLEAFSSEKSLLYILEGYPREQFALQKNSSSFNQSLTLVLISSRTALKEIAPLIKEYIEKYLSFSNGVFSLENEWSDTLYHLSKRLLFNIRAERLGKKRCFALHLYETIQHWHDPHKGVPLAIPLGPPQKDFLGELYKKAYTERKPRISFSQGKIHLAHVVTQVVDGGHAPTILIKNLLLNSDKEKFDSTVMTTERLVHYPLEYPIPLRDSLSSLLRGPRTLHSFKQAGINTIVNTECIHYEATARYLASVLNMLQVDVVVFHGPDETNNLIASLVEAPLRVLFDHGTLPSYPCYDAAILSSEDAIKLHGDRLKALGMESAVLMFCVDVRKGWETHAYTKEELGFPSNSFLMTTISHHLEARLSEDFCHAIGQILQRCPTAYYAPLGPISNEEKFRKIFSEYDVNSRVVFMGYHKNPSQYARTMDLYLNEYPFGSGIGILDAMAAGCPVVSMFDEKGPQQARYGGTYFGLDRVLHNGSTEEYVNLACRLCEDKALYKEWVAHARAQYEKRANEKEYAKSFEAIIQQFIKTKSFYQL